MALLETEESLSASTSGWPSAGRAFSWAKTAPRLALKARTYVHKAELTFVASHVVRCTRLMLLEFSFMQSHRLPR